MTSASVGFQCPECVSEGAATVREARTVGGGRVPATGGLVTRGIVVITVGVFVLQLLTGGREPRQPCPRAGRVRGRGRASSTAC